MAEKFHDLGGVITSASSLSLRRARELVATLRKSKASFASLIECRSTTDGETVVFEVEVERPQVVSYGIQRIERMAAVFRRDDAIYPDVLALRTDFAATLHLNQRFEEFPRSLCLYDRSWSEVRITWTAPAFVERIRWWLKQTARDELHAEDQALEAFLLSWNQWLVLPSSKAGEEKAAAVAVTFPGGKEGRVFVAFDADPNSRNQPGLPFVVLRFTASKRRHGVVPRIPRTLADLAAFLAKEDFDLLASIRERLQSWPTENEKLLNHSVILLVDLPKTRGINGPIESVEHKAFLTVKSVVDLGVALGVWVIQNKKRARLLNIDGAKNGDDVKLDMLNVCDALTRGMAAVMNGLQDENNLKVVAVGAGALGSQVAMNLARAGWGRWTIVDKDDLLPHNLARHALNGEMIGWDKASGLALEINWLCRDPNTASALRADVLRPGDDAKSLQERLQNADVILDLSASVAVGRHLSALDLPARRISLFLSPSGKDLVLLGEDRLRKVNLDHLEMTYYAAIATQENLSSHLDPGAGPVRYGLSCRDVSSRIPQAAVGTLAGIGASAVRQLLDGADAGIRVWRLDPTTLGVVPVVIESETFLTRHLADWTFQVSPRVLRYVTDRRKERLPKETGGVLLGGVDYDRKIVYLTLALPSPPDSQEWPTHYIRGCQELREQVEAIQNRTAANLGYIGEWHSHPDRTATMPSKADKKVFSWIAEHTLAEGKPPVMLIAGEGGRARLLVGSSAGKLSSEELCLP